MLFQKFFTLNLVVTLALSMGTQSVSANAFEPPPEQDAPSSTAGGGSRPSGSGCTWDETSSTQALALAPQTFVGLSNHAQPTLWLYLPTMAIAGIELSIFDAQLNGMVQSHIERPDAAGLVSVSVPESFSLSEDSPYYWTAAFICNPERRTEDWVVGGWISYQPRSAEAEHDLQTLPHLGQVKQHIDTGYWYDALTELLSVTDMTLPSLEKFPVWNTLLQQADLNNTGIDLHDAARAPE